MTEDYKKNLINFVSGLLNKTSSNPTDFDPYNYTNTTNEYTDSDWDIVMNALTSKFAEINGILEDESSDIYIIYGAYDDIPATQAKGFLIYMNQDNKPFKVRTLPNVRGFQWLGFDKESNRVYGAIGDRGGRFTSNDNDVYFAYFNNLFLTYEDYYLPNLRYETKIFTGSGGSTTNQLIVKNIVKHPDKSYYLINGMGASGDDGIKVIELQIKTGASNELTNWTIDQTYSNSAFYGWYTDETPHFKLIATTTTPSFKLIEDNGTSITETNLSYDSTLVAGANETANYICLDKNNMWFVYNTRTTSGSNYIFQCWILKYDGTTTIKTIYKTPSTTATTIKNVPMANLVQDVNVIYAIRYLNSDDNNEMKISVCNLNNHATPIDSDFKNIGTTQAVASANIYNERARLKRNYNLISFVSLSGYFQKGRGNPNQDINGSCNVYTTIVSQLGYTGYPYVDYDTFVPNYVNLYNNNNILFSRNIYNTTTFENSMTTSVEVLNNYLNDIVIDEEKLIGQTNVELVDATKSIDKNIYEILHINFLNTINVIDEETNKEYKLGAIKVNNGIVAGTQTSYDNTKCLKYRINYVDGTNVVNSINWVSINELNKQTNFTIYVDKAIKNIDLISNDNSTIYLTINGEFEVGNYYSIYQKVRIGDKPEQQNLVYNAQNVLYNGEQVKVYTI